jgi:hypothetical protein
VHRLKDKVAVSTDAMYVILGASGNTGSIIDDSLLSKPKKGRDAEAERAFRRRSSMSRERSSLMGTS